MTGTIAKTLGQLAYEGYGKHRNWKTFDERPMPTWAELRPDIQEAWQVAADCAVSGQQTFESSEG